MSETAIIYVTACSMVSVLIVCLTVVALAWIRSGR